MNIVEACRDDNLFKPFFKDPESWNAWFAFLRVLFALDLNSNDLSIFKQCTGRTYAPAAAFQECWLICGRRAGKSFCLALIAVFLACFKDWRPYLQPGERATIMILACDQKQARVIFRYIRGLLENVPMLAAKIQRQTQSEIELEGQVTIEVHTSNYRSVRGPTVVAVLCDEIAFWMSEDSTSPDYEVLNALRPAMATVPGAMLLCASSPYARRGEVYKAHKKHWGKDSSEVLIWRAPTRVMNPTVSQAVIDKAYADDPEAAKAEYGAEFRSDIESFISREVVESCVEPGRYELPWLSDVRYFGFCDPSGGRADSMTLAIAHRQGERVVIDAVREATSPFNPDSVTGEFATLLKSYGLSAVTGDRYGGEWPRERFAQYGITYLIANKTRSELYLELLPLLNSGRVELLDHPRLIKQLCELDVTSH